MTAPQFIIRPAQEADDPAILELFNHEIREGLALWNTAERSIEEIHAWRRGRISEGFPVLVICAENQFAGYGSFGPFRPHDAYAGAVEHSLYIKPSYQGRGAGGLMLKALEAEACLMKKRVMLGAIEAGNKASLRVHERAGFVETGRMPDVGRKFDQWLTLVFMQKILT